MPTGRIIKRSVDAADPGFLWDQDLRGFGLKVTPAGARSYVYQYRMGGRETTARRYTIGTHGSPWTPTTAREEAERLALMVRKGIDPREDQRTRRRESVELAFRSYTERFLELYVRSEWPASYDFAESILRLHVVPVLGDKPLPNIGKSDVTDVLDRLPPKKPALKRNVYAVLRRLLRWAVGRGDLDRSPLEGFEAPPSVASRERVLSDVELALIWRASLSLGYPFGPLFQLLMITGQRREEVAALAWEELDRSSATWLLPAGRSKNGRSHIVPLGRTAVEVLDTVARGAQWPRRGFVFTTTGKTAVSGYSRAKRRLDQGIKLLQTESSTNFNEIGPVPAWRVHDLRRTLATGLQRLGVRFEVTEAVLNHLSGARSGVAGVYQRHDWAEEKREALSKWSEALERLVSENTVATRPAVLSNVTPILLRSAHRG
jgi:integrase